MSDLFTKDEDLQKSAPYIGFKILKMLNASEDERVSIFDVAKNLRKTNDLSVRGIYFGVIFLYALEIIEFDQPYLVKYVNN
jgi:hypothetical protein